jgi:hypothetical protein
MIDDGPTFDNYIIATVHQTADRQVTSARPHHCPERFCSLGWVKQLALPLQRGSVDVKEISK